MGADVSGVRSRTVAGPRARVARQGRGLLRRPGLRLLSGLLGGLILLGGAYVWLRDSSLVAIQNVRVAGATGPDAPQIRAALRSAARTMTTLDVRISALQTAVAPFPAVKSLDVGTQFPHGMSIRVREQEAVAIVSAPGRRIPVAGDGTLLRDNQPNLQLPTISLPVAPGGSRLEGYALSEARLLAAAPWQLLPRLSQVSDSSQHGLAAQVRGGPSLYFGGGGQLPAKWTAVTEVLASSGSSGAQYIDVTDPNRPAAGAGSDTASSTPPAIG